MVRHHARQVIAAFLFGSAYLLYQQIVYLRPSLLDPVPTMIDLPISFVVRQICAFTLMLCIVVADYVTGRDTHRRAAYALAVVASAAVVAPVESLVLLATWPEIAEMRIVSVSFFGLNLEKFAEWLILGGAATFVYTDRRRALAARARMHAAELERTHAAKRTIESRLQAMQARVEPQFLFNTLAQVHDLYRADRALGERMLDELIAYLRAAMPKMRDTSWTVGQEIELVRAYLCIVQAAARRAARFRDRDTRGDFRRPDAPDDAAPPSRTRDRARPCQPQATGSIHIRAESWTTGPARNCGQRRRLPPESEGQGIADIRERLDALYGARARLALERRAGDATEAVLELPLEVETHAASIEKIPSSRIEASGAGA